MAISNIKVIIPCDIQKVWETISAIEHYPTWRSGVMKTEVIDEKQFIEYAKDDYSTTFMVTAIEPHRRWELDMENGHIKGHWRIVLSSKGNETEIDITTSVTAKKLSVRPVGKSVFEQTYLKKEQTQFVTDFKKALG